jgi:Flp pilus assembly protein TadG
VGWWRARPEPWRWKRTWRVDKADRESGVALVEFALVVPLLAMFLLGIITSGSAYSQRISLSNAAREGSRYGASLSVSSASGGTMNGWLQDVATAAQQAATGDAEPGAAGRRICVAYMYPNGSTSTDQTTMLVRTDSGDTFSNPAANAACFTGGDGRPVSERRVQVTVERTATIEALVYSRTVTLTGKAVTMYEAKR